MTVENPKLIITGGCSASTKTPNSRNINWPMHIHDRVKTNLINTAVGGSGNISISRRIVQQTVWNIIPCTILNHQKQVYYGINIFNMI